MKFKLQSNKNYSNNTRYQINFVNNNSTKRVSDNCLLVMYKISNLKIN